jgi:DNA-directed RNA polymerase specialized sigma24 family protein
LVSGDPAARDQLLIRHRERLRKMIAVRMDRRLSGRCPTSRSSGWPTGWWRAGPARAGLLRDELLAQVRQALERLSPRDREVMVMRHLEQLSIREIAAVLGVTEGSVKVRLVRALQRLHQSLGDVSPEGAP